MVAENYFTSEQITGSHLKEVCVEDKSYIAYGVTVIFPIVAHALSVSCVRQNPYFATGL